MNSPGPPDDPDQAEDATTPTIAEGLSFADLRAEFDRRDISDAREFLARLDAEERRAAAREPTRLATLGPFRDLVEIGRGGMGVVYRARDPETGADVAVKVPCPGLAPSPAALWLFAKEAEAVGRLDHPAIVPHRPLNFDGERIYIVSAFCDGPDLERWLRARRRPVPPREAARIIRETADAVAHAHARGVLHRDVKPSNVLLPGADEASAAEELAPKLTDFGLAKLIDEETSPLAVATATGLVRGSPPYMAPEQASGRSREIDPRADVYGLGAVLYELLTALPPFKGETPTETLGLVMVADPVPVRVLRPKVPRALEAIVLQCLEKRRDRRYPTAAALRDDLDAFLEGRRVRARRPGPVERLRRWARRRPRSAAAVGLSLAVALILTAGAASWTIALGRGLERAERHAYASRVDLAHRAFHDGQLVRAQPILHNLIPRDGGRDRREFAWHYLWRRCRREARMIFDIDFDPHQLALSPEGLTLACGGEDAVAVLDLERESLVWRAPIPTGMALEDAPVFSADGARIVLRMLESRRGPGRARAVEIRRVSDGGLLGRRAFPLGENVRPAGFLKDGRLLLIVHDGVSDQPHECEFATCSAEGGLEDVAPRLRFARVLAHSPDGRRALLVDPERGPGVRDLAAGSFIPLAGAADGGLGRCVFSADGRRVALARAGGAGLLIHDAEDGRLLRRLPPIAAAVVDVAFQPGGEAVAVTTAAPEIRLIDPSRGVDVRVFPNAPESEVDTRRVRFAPDGRVFFVHWAEYLGADHIEIRSADDGRRLGESPARYKGMTGDWAFLPGPRPELIHALGPHAWRWEWSRTVTADPEAKDVLDAHHGDEVWGVAFSPDGALLATAADNEAAPTTIRLRDRDGRIVREWSDGDSTAADLVFAPDGSWIATTHLSQERAVRIRPTRGGGEVVSVELPDGEWGRAVDADPTRPVIYVGGDRGTILAWNIDRRRVEWRVEPPPERRVPFTHERILDLAIAPDGRRLAVANDLGIVRSLDPRTGAVLASYRGRSPMLAVAYCPDNRIVAAGDQEGRIHLLAAAALRPNQVIPGDDTDLRALAFSPDGLTLAAAGLGRVVRLWDPATGEELLTLTGHRAQINALAFSPDGQTLASADHAGIVRFWRGPREEVR